MYKEISEKLEQYLLLKGKEYLNIIIPKRNKKNLCNCLIIKPK